MHDFYDLLPGCEGFHHLGAQGTFLYFGYEVLYDLEVYVCFQQCHADFTHAVLDILFGEIAAAFEATEDFIQTVGKTIEHQIPFRVLIAFV
ncbi:hypothetical protein DSECCO2_441260 [anaerobic digester metagenome]